MLEKPQILVVEDDPLVSDIVTAALDDAYRTIPVVNAADAMKLLRDGGFRLMLLDCTLPGGIGADLLPEADRADTKVILMSGDPGRVAKLSDRPRPFILKPFTLLGLMNVVKKVLDTETSNEPAPAAE